MTTKAEKKLEHAEDVLNQAAFVIEAAVEKQGEDETAAGILTRAARTVLNSYLGED